MSLTRSFLKGIGLTEEQVSAIIEGHLETVDPLKERAKVADELETKLKEVQKELDALKDEKGDGFKEKYEKEHADFEAYRKTVAGEKETAEKKSKFQEILKKAGIGEKYLDAVMRVTNLDTIKLTNGEIENTDALIADVKKDWPEFIGTEGTRGANVQNPPLNTGTKKTKEEIMAIKDQGERQKAISENHELFGF